KLIDGIKNDRAHGASELARQAVEILKVVAERSLTGSVEQFLHEQREIGERLMLVRPAMASLFNIINRLLQITVEAQETSLDSIKRLTISKADEAINSSSQAVAQTAYHVAQLIADSDRIMTNSYSSTVVASLKQTFTEHWNIEVITTRSGPRRSGERTAQQLGLYGIPITFIDDTAMGLYISSVNKAVVGADRVCADGKVVNGIGTYQLALAAKRVSVPFYVLCETLKFDSRLQGDEVDLEEKEPSEVFDLESFPPEVKAKNPFFDITPPELITGIVTENGLLLPQEVISYIKQSI
ncbi:translation initiation factor eIF-2B, partial [Chloroflexota bacterium]